MLTYVWLLAAMGSAVDVEMSLLGETLVAVGTVAHISLSRSLGITLNRRAGGRARLAGIKTNIRSG